MACDRCALKIENIHKGQRVTILNFGGRDRSGTVMDTRRVSHRDLVGVTIDGYRGTYDFPPQRIELLPE